MTMYLPNPDMHPTGVEPGEYLELPPMSDEVNQPPMEDAAVPGAERPEER